MMDDGWNLTPDTWMSMRMNRTGCYWSFLAVLCLSWSFLVYEFYYDYNWDDNIDDENADEESMHFDRLDCLLYFHHDWYIE